MQELKANTEVIVTIGPFVDVADGFTPQTDIALSGNEAELIKHGLTAVVDISGATWAAVTDCRGYYSLTLTASYTDTEGMLLVVVQDDSDCLPVKTEFLVLSEAAWDSKYAAKDTGYMDVNVKAMDANVLTATAINADAITNAKIADDAISSENLNTGAITADAFAADAIIAATLATDAITTDALADGTITAAKLGADCITAAKIGDDAIAAEHLAAGAIANATFNADVGSTAYGTNIIALAVRKVLNELRLNYLMKDPAAYGDDMTAEIVDESVLAHMLTISGSITDYDPATDSLQAIRDNTGTAGAGLVEVALADATSDAVLADAIWNAATVTYGSAGSYGEALEAAGAAGDPWLTNLPGAYGAGTAGEIVGDWKNGERLDLLLDAIPTTAMRGTDSAALASVCTEGRLAELDAGNLPADVAAIPTTAMRGTDSAALASVCTEGRLAELDAGNLPTDIAAIPTTAMRGTDNAALASVCTEVRLAELAAANLPTDIAAIQTTTDKLQFTATNFLQADVQYVNAVALTGAGTIGDEWGP